VVVPATAWTHESWKTIGFQITDGQYFSYELETEPDGRRIHIRALDDLEGTGQVGCWERTLFFGINSNDIVTQPEIFSRPCHGVRRSLP